MRVFIAGLATETNTFAPIPTGLRRFEDGFLAHGDATRRPPNYMTQQLLTWRSLAEQRGWDVTESLCTFANPAGRVVRSVHESLRDEILSDLARAGPCDIVLFALHGAMAAEGCDDCEGDLLTRARGIAGPAAVIGAELDLHCHVSDAMLRAATLLVGYKEYPHVDIAARAEDLFRLAADAATGKTRPVMAAFDCRMIGLFPTTRPPLREFVDRMAAREGRDGILAAWLAHGFPWGDVADVGAKAIVIADGDADGAARAAASLGREFFALRRQVMPDFLALDDALDRALAIDGGPVVIADLADNSGGGAPGDSTFFLRRLLERGIGNAATGYYWDPQAVILCHEAGIGARFDLRIGGKLGPASGQPVDVAVTVKGLAADVVQHLGDAPDHLGPSAWVAADGIDIVLASQHTQVFHPEGFGALGLDVGRRKIVIVKSTQHFHAGFAPIAAAVLYAAAPGALQPDFAAIPYTKLTRPYWPRIADPFAD